MDDYMKLAFVLFAYMPMMIISVAMLVFFIICMCTKIVFPCPFVWIDLLFAVTIPVGWRYLVPLINPRVGLNGYGIIFYVGAAWSLFIVARYVAIRFFAMTKSRVVFCFSALQLVAFAVGILLTFILVEC